MDERRDPQNAEQTRRTRKWQPMTHLGALIESRRARYRRVGPDGPVWLEDPSSCRLAQDPTMHDQSPASTPFAVLHIPHASRQIPPNVRPALLLSDDGLDVELTRMTDAYTDELFATPPELATAVEFPVSRLVLDPERFTDDEQEPMTRVGMGVIYTRTSQQVPLRRPPSLQEREALLDRFYRPHHARLTAGVRAALVAHGSALCIDCHSFPAEPLPFELDPTAQRLDICIGTDAFHTPDWLRELAVTIFSDRGLSVELDRPFGGALVPLEFYQSDPRVLSVMIEVNRGLYMDEQTGAKIQGFASTRAVVQAAVEELIEQAVEHVRRVGS